MERTHEGCSWRNLNIVTQLEIHHEGCAFRQRLNDVGLEYHVCKRLARKQDTRDDLGQQVRRELIAVNKHQPVSAQNLDTWKENVPTGSSAHKYTPLGSHTAILTQLPARSPTLATPYATPHSPQSTDKRKLQTPLHTTSSVPRGTPSLTSHEYHPSLRLLSLRHATPLDRNTTQCERRCKRRARRRRSR